MNIDELLEKAFTSSDLSSGGLLNAEQSAKFIQEVIENSVVIKEARRIPMKSDKKQIDKITYGSNILQKPNAVGSDPSSTSEPTTSKVTLDSEEVIVAIDIGYDTLEDNIEGESLFDTIMDLTDKEMAYEMDKLVLNGDADGGTSDYLEILDGVFELISTNTYDATASTLSDTVLFNTLKDLDGKYLDNEEALRFYVSHKAKLDYVKALADKNVNEAFVRYLLENNEPRYQGIPVRKVPAITTESVTEGTGTTNGSKALLIDPKNILYGVHRDITYEFDRQPRKRIIEVTVTMRVAVELEEEEACVKVTNVKHST